MRVKLAYKAHDTPKGTIKVLRKEFDKVGDAREYYKKNWKYRDDIVWVCLRRFDGWRWFTYQILKGGKKI